MFDGIERVIKSLFSGQRGLQFNPLKGTKFTIRIRDGKNERVISNIKPKSSVRIQSRPKNIKMPSELIEPEAEVKRLGDELEIIIELPGVKSLGNINISRLGESIEVKAISKNKGYFKIISIPSNYRITGKSIKNEVLTVRLVK